MDDLIEALQIFRKYVNPNRPTNCNHDELFVDCSPTLVSVEDINRLHVLGFIEEKEYDGFLSFKFGQC